MAKTNIIVIPPFYDGTSFQDIVKGLIIAVRKSNIPIKFIGNKIALKNNLSDIFLDDERYIQGQIKIIKEVIGKSDLQKVLFLDFFNPGLDLMRYSHEQRGMKVKYGSLLHGGSFLEEDLYSFDWIGNFEKAWFDVYDNVYVPSNFLASLCQKRYKDKIKVFPWGMDGAYFKNKNTKKRWDVIFPHRLNNDKGAEDLIKIIKLMPNISFAIAAPQEKKVIQNNKYYKEIKDLNNVTFIVNKSGKKHFDTLSMSHIIISCSKQETFGYSIMKGVLAGCIPILPKKLNYPEFFNNAFLYSNISGAMDLINKHVKNSKNSIVNKDLIKIKNSIKSFSFEKIINDFFK